MQSIVVVFSGDMFDPFALANDAAFEARLLTAPEEVRIPRRGCTARQNLSAVHRIFLYGSAVFLEAQCTDV
jgi:hypothetical protein